MSVCSTRTLMLSNCGQIEVKPPPAGRLLLRSVIQSLSLGVISPFDFGVFCHLGLTESQTLTTWQKSSPFMLPTCCQHRSHTEVVGRGPRRDEHARAR